MYIYVVCMCVCVCACVLCLRCCQIGLITRKDIRKTRHHLRMSQEIFKMKKDIVRYSIFKMKKDIVRLKTASQDIRKTRCLSYE